MDVLDRIRKIMKERGLTEYGLAKKSGISQSTLSNMFKRNTIPTIPTLESICKGFGITLSQFFTEENMTELSDEQFSLFEKWVYLTNEQKNLIFEIISNFDIAKP